jgi:hypothetical protein
MLFHIPLVGPIYTMNDEKGLIDELVSTSENLSDIRASLINAIPCSEYDRHQLGRMGFSNLLMVYAAWRDRFISPRRRTVQAWDGFWTARVNDHVAAITNIASISEAGGELTPYLSPRVHVEGFSPRASKAGGLIVGSKDRALNAYRVHHLHLVPANSKGKRSGESKALLFVRVFRSYLNLIYLGDHRSFDDGTLRQAVADAEVANDEHIRGIDGVSRNVSAAEGEALLRRGVNTLTASGGKWAFTGGLSTAMTSLWHRRDVDRILITIEELEPLTRTPEGRMEICRRFGVEYDEGLRFGWGLEHLNLFLVEVNSRRAVAQCEWPR